jgi:transcriptional regulator with XRE-family HTH domain
MKKAARELAKKLFIDSKGNVSNKKIAERVKVNPLTVSRWRKSDQWESELRELLGARGFTGVRKKEQRDRALALFLKSGGTVRNSELARQAGVSAGTIASWKAIEDWNSLVVEAAARAADEEIEPDLESGVEAAAERARDEEETGERAFYEGEDEEDAIVEISPNQTVSGNDPEVGSQIMRFVAPEHILMLNDRIERLLQRDHLSPSEVAKIAYAKREAVEAVKAYTSIMDRLRRKP